MLKVDDIEVECVRGGIGGMFVFAAEAPFVAAALRLLLLFVVARPKPWRLGEFVPVSVVDFFE